ncbi:MAG: hypothetical protein MZV65_13190 [Chromatiales bacterium]|nr:hypothetical protein [Chromatiales bacterium]
MSYAEMMRAVRRGGRPAARASCRVPVLTPKLSAYWLALVTTVPASIARALIGGLKHDIPADDARAARAGAAAAADLHARRWPPRSRPSARTRWPRAGPKAR